MEQTIGNVPYVAPQTLLIVDDDAINRGILDNIFSAYYKVEEEFMNIDPYLLVNLE